MPQINVSYNKSNFNAMSNNKVFSLNYADRGDNRNTLVIGYKK